ALEDVVGVLGDIESIDLDPLAELKDVEKLQEQIEESIAYIDTIIDALQSVVDELEDSDLPNEEQIEQLEQTIAGLEEIKEVLESSLDSTEKVLDLIEEYEADIESILEELKDISSSVDIDLGEFKQKYQNEIEPALLSELQRARQILVEAKAVLQNVEGAI